MTWLVLYRDTRDGTACTSEENIAARIGCSKRAVVKRRRATSPPRLLVQVFKGGTIGGRPDTALCRHPNHPRR